jgi:hypothetical protein
VNEYPTIHCPIADTIETTPDELAFLAPLLDHLRANVPVTQQTTFPRGTVMPDGRLDLCKQGIGAAGCRSIAEALTVNTRITSLLTQVASYLSYSGG